MSAFKIKYENGIAVPINQIDQIAADFWEVEFHEKSYACPKGRGVNWFDSIGWNIACPTGFSGVQHWEHVKESMFFVQIRGELYKMDEQKRKERLREVDNYLRPYFAFIDHLNNLKYIPVTIVNS